AREASEQAAGGSLLNFRTYKQPSPAKLIQISRKTTHFGNYESKAPKMCEQALRKLFVCAALVVNSHLLGTRS
ncbi:MAG: hypothetical protein SOX74_08475, partial [Candidatus Faecousia sp.]|uniref:hypothetical protein n=1 Tax=Faecousia sp. TaxID=2952921 RepID=UPI002A84F0B8|nr:hypothetical protein [Candidatus Faecousia sp.]